MTKHLILVSLAASAVLADTFTLGQINVLNTPLEDSPFEQTISSETIAKQNSETVADALDNTSGVSLGMMGARNETTVSIRGFDAKRVGVFIDGIPVYVPYDGNFDYDRFLTSDIAQIDVAKGFSSIAYGANTMGGVVNIISKRPTKALEGDIKAGMVLDSDTALSRKTASLNIGTRQDHLYAQLGAVYSDQSHFSLSDDYSPVAGSVQPKGDRLRSQSEDYKISLKGGYIADDGSEIAIGYSNQNAQKQQPPSTNSAYNSVRYWDWPYWDKESLFITGQKNFGNSYLKALAYYDKFQNSLYSYANNTYSTFNSFGSTFKSRYDDYSAGARLEYGVELDKHFLTAAANYKKDVHKGYDISKTTDAETMSENYEDHTVSFGFEDVYTHSSQWQILGGFSYDRREGDKIYDTNTAYIDMLALRTQSAFNPEAAVVFSPDATSKIRASISRKTYMPTMKDRYSRKFNSYVPNPDLDNEVATHYELSYQKNLGAFSTRLNGYFTRVDDAIQSVLHTSSGLLQNQNVGSFDHRGVEAEFNYQSDGLEAGGNYSYISVKNRTDESIKRTDVPRHQLFAYTQVDVGANVALYGDMKFRKGAYDQITDYSYIITPSFTTFDLKAIYKPTAHITAEAGIKNLTDKLVQYDLGFPVAGREFFANIGYTF
ncbi:TonB-dependent receptor plug domain-containing protein [Sulfuricurvum sp.]|uniref:TonB-dependent receptor plug domain-containing protein n=1 Tax=Sulfuricurvum sp. TaxID=2025608 RepID=UPI003BB21D40